MGVGLFIIYPGPGVKVLAVFVSGIGSDSRYRAEFGDADEAITMLPGSAGFDIIFAKLPASPILINCYEIKQENSYERCKSI